MVQMTCFAGNMSQGRSKVAFRGAKADTPCRSSQFLKYAVFSCGCVPYDMNSN